jgi:hypothetical protein
VVPSRVGAGVVEMMGGGACAALVEKHRAGEPRKTATCKNVTKTSCVPWLPNYAISSLVPPFLMVPAYEATLTVN